MDDLLWIMFVDLCSIRSPNTQQALCSSPTKKKSKMEKTSRKSFLMTASLVVLLVCCLSFEVCIAREGISKIETTENSADSQWLWGGLCPWTFPHPRLPPFWFPRPHFPRLPPFPFPFPLPLPRHWPPCHGFPWPAPAPKPAPKPTPKPAPKPSPAPPSPANGTDSTNANTSTNPSHGTSTLPRSKSTQTATSTSKPASATPKTTN